jgi:hypothetical protein
VDVEPVAAGVREVPLERRAQLAGLGGEVVYDVVALQRAPPLSRAASR